MSEDLENLLIRNNINMNDFLDKMGNELLLTAYEEYDPLISRFAITDERKPGKVSISEILGYRAYHMQSRNILNNFENFFDSYGDGYHSRSVSMLNYKPEEIMAGLSESFKIEPIKLNKIGNKYFISSNGLHRFMILKINYLIQLYKGIPEYELAKEYSVPVEYTEINLNKTYLNYIASLFITDKFDVRAELVDFKYTDNLYVKFNNEEYIFNEEELKEFLLSKLEELKETDYFEYEDIISDIWQECLWDKNNYLKEFINTNIPNISFITEIKDYNEMKKKLKENLYGNKFN